MGRKLYFIFFVQKNPIFLFQAKLSESCILWPCRVACVGVQSPQAADGAHSRGAPAVRAAVSNRPSRYHQTIPCSCSFCVKKHRKQLPVSAVACPSPHPLSSALASLPRPPACSESPHGASRPWACQPDRGRPGNFGATRATALACRWQAPGGRGDAGDLHHPTTSFDQHAQAPLGKLERGMAT